MEDEAVINLDLRKFLADFNLEVLEPAYSFKTALDIALKEKPEIIVMDVYLKDEKTGIDAAIEINKHYAPLIIFFSGSSTNELIDQIKFLNHGILKKPIDKDDLIRIIYEKIDDFECTIVFKPIDKNNLAKKIEKYF